MITSEFTARRLRKDELEKAQQDLTDRRRLFCVEHSSGVIVARPSSWSEAVAERDHLNAEALAYA